MQLLTLTGCLVPARITTEHSASCHGLPVVVICGNAYGSIDLVGYGYQLAEASPDEIAELERGGYTALLRSALPAVTVPDRYRRSEQEATWK